jgi:hypothetical protein
MLLLLSSLLNSACGKVFTLTADGSLISGVATPPASPPPPSLPRVALVTAIFGAYDHLKPLPFALPNAPSDGVELSAICFTDDPGLAAMAPPGWRVEFVGAGGTPPWPPARAAGAPPPPAWHGSPLGASNRTRALMAAKWFKVQGHRVPALRGFAAMLWADASTRITFAALPRYLGALLAGAPPPAGAPALSRARGGGAPPGAPPPAPARLWLFPHPERDSPVEEALVCALTQPRYGALPLLEQAAAYMRAGYPFACASCAAGAELWALTAFFRAFGAREDGLFDAWWAEILAWGTQDQVSLPFALWRGGAEPAGVWRGQHVKRSFLGDFVMHRGGMEEYGKI